MSHTPGPFTSDGTLVTKEGRFIANCHSSIGSTPQPEDAANAVLLAAAPDLLAALRELADTNNDFSEALVRARLAIARATTGEKS